MEERDPEAVAAALEQDGDAVYLDVRSVGEFAAGHVPGSLNIPIAEPDPNQGMMILNPDFLAVVAASVNKTATVYCGCASGPRSRHAVTLLHEAGYPTAFNVYAGFKGVVDPLGRVIEPGWESRGLPVEQGDGGAFSYASLRDAARGADG